MQSNRKGQLITIAVLLAAMAFVLVRKTGSHLPGSGTAQTASRTQETPGPSPQDAIYAMLAAARAGNVNAYLASYTGSMEAALKQIVAETSDAGFAKYLRDTNASVKGIAISEPEKITDSEAKVRIERIFQDRNETQTVYLEKHADGWKICRADSEEHVNALIPYGTPVK